MDALIKAVEKAGGQKALATAIGVKQAHVWNWLNRDKHVPEGHCPAIEEATGVRCELLRPDLQWKRNAKRKVVGYFVKVA